MAKKQAAPLPPEPSEAQIETESLELELQSNSLEAQAKEKLKPETVRIVKKIAYYIAKVGLPLNEACMLVDVDFVKFQEQMKLEPLIDKIIKMKELEYKKDLLYSLSQRARDGNDSDLAQWLLEKRYPKEFGSAKKREDGGSGDFLLEAIEFIQKNGSSNNLVNETSGRSLVIKKSTAYGIVEKIGNVLDNAQQQ